MSILGHRSNAVRAYKRTSSEQEVQASDILYGVNATKSKKIKEQERCETLDKGCVEINKDVNQSKIIDKCNHVEIIDEINKSCNSKHTI